MNTRLNKKTATVKQKVKENFSESAETRSLLNAQKSVSIKLLHKLYNLLKHYESLYISQEKLAVLLGVSRKTINIAAQELHDAGLIVIEKRGLKQSHIYHLSTLLENNRETLLSFFKIFFLFSVISLSSKLRSGAEVTQELFNVNYFKQTTTTALSNRYHYGPQQWPYLMVPPEDYQPNQPVSLRRFMDLLAVEVAGQKKEPKKGKSMYHFTQEQLATLATYSKEALDYANRSYTKALHEGKEIHDPFKWYLAVCNSFTLKRHTQKTPEKGQAMSSTPSTGPRSVWKSPPRRDEETDYEWCSKVEPKLHEFTLANNPGLKITKPYADVRWNRLTPEQQETIMTFAHPNCNCRPKIDSPVATAEKTWNDKMLQTVDKMSAVEDNMSTTETLPPEALGYEDVF